MFLIFEGGISAETLAIIGAGILGFIVLRLKVVKEYFSSSKGVIENLKTELETLQRKHATVEMEVRDLREENKVLHREIRQGLEIHWEDRDTIRELKKQDG